MIALERNSRTKFSLLTALFAVLLGLFAIRCAVGTSEYDIAGSAGVDNPAGGTGGGSSSSGAVGGSATTGGAMGIGGSDSAAGGAPAAGGTGSGGITGIGGSYATGGANASGGAAVYDPSCSDGEMNNTETDIDCGGSCPRCTEGQSCEEDTDCVTRNCEGGTCGPSTHCLSSWESSSCASLCTEAMPNQSDVRTCSRVLDCWLEHDCGPSTCGEFCTTNYFGVGTSCFPPAEAVWACLDCP
jgi:hypothetical protein